MEGLITIFRYRNPDIAVIRFKNQLEEEGIPFFDREEHVPRFRGAKGVIELQIYRKDVKRALGIMREMQLTSAIEITNPQEDDLVLTKLDEASRKLKIFNSLSPGKRIIASFILIASIITAVAYLLFAPSTKESLTQHSWCVDHVTYNGRAVYPHSTGFVLVSPDHCAESIAFYKNGEILLPGFNTIASRGNWEISNKKLIISTSEYGKEIYEGEYEVDFSSTGTLVLTSPKTTIRAHYNQW